MAGAAAAAPLPGLEQQVRAARRVSSALGVHVLDLESGETVYAYQPDQPLVLASNTKLLTTAAVLDALGPGFLFETRLLARGALDDGTLDGDLAVVGAGDPLISGRPYDGDPYGVFRAWAAALRAQGIFRVRGRLHLVHGLFDDQRIHPDWPRDQLTNWYEAPVDALSFNDNCVLVQVWPGRSGGPAVVETVPELPTLSVNNTARTCSSRKSHKVVISRALDGDELKVSGCVWREAGPVEAWVTVRDPVTYFGAALRDAFAEEGVVLAGETLRPERLPDGVWQDVAAYRTDLQSVLEVTNKRSQNFFAESLLKLLGARRCGDGSWAGGVRALGEFLARVGFAPGTYTLADGSGMSRRNRATPRQLTRLLSFMFAHRHGREFMLSLAYSGEPGLRWEKRLAEAPYGGNVFAKTGTLNGISTLSGYAKARSGRLYAFSILCNGTRGAWAAQKAQDSIVRALVDQG